MSEADSQDPRTPEPIAPATPRPLPWEDEGAFPSVWKRLGGMFSLLFSSPLELVDRVPVTEGLAPAWRFSVLMAVPSLLFMALIFGFIGTIFTFAPPDPNLPKGFMVAIVGGELALFVLITMVGMFIQGAILHLFLWMWGGARNGRGLAQTIRLCGYVWGFVHLGSLIPCLGALLVLAGLAFLAVGLARVHRTDTWRGACAVATPILLCCLCYGAIIALAIGASALK